MEHGMGMEMAMAPSTGGGPGVHTQHQKMMMHMTFFWGKDVEVLFDGWPGTSLGMYILRLVFVFFVSFLVEWLVFCRLAQPTAGGLAAGLLQTLVYTLRTGLGYLVMLAVMSFNGGVLLVAVAGHALGFLLFGSRVFQGHQQDYEKHQNEC